MQLTNQQYSKLNFLSLPVLRSHYFFVFLFGCLGPLGFAPFHVPGALILSLSVLFAHTLKVTKRQAVFLGFVYGIGYFGIGTSWVYVSIHAYGHLNILLSAFLTFLFIAYLSLFTALATYSFKFITPKNRPLIASLSFSALWILCEYFRSQLLSGFPWLLAGYAQMDTPGKILLPIIGIYGSGFFICLSATFLTHAAQTYQLKRTGWIIGFLAMLLVPNLLSNKQWTQRSKNPVSVAAIQANLSMKDKWDETLFWQLLAHYKDKTKQLIGHKDVIILPESAIPIPQVYITEFLDDINQYALRNHTSVLLGIPGQSPKKNFYNSLISLGQAQGEYHKIHLVPFGEYIPRPFKKISKLLDIPIVDMEAGLERQSPVTINGIPIATLICYELAYPSLLRPQLPNAHWIVSISDYGWFGHSLAAYQQIQMAQALSVLTGRYQIVVNNDGLSSIINNDGEIKEQLPAFTAGVLVGDLYSGYASTPWVTYGDQPLLLTLLALIVTILLLRILPYKRRKIKQLVFDK